MQSHTKVEGRDTWASAAAEEEGLGELSVCNPIQKWRVGTLGLRLLRKRRDWGSSLYAIPYKSGGSGHLGFGCCGRGGTGGALCMQSHTKVEGRDTWASAAAEEEGLGELSVCNP